MVTRLEQESIIKGVKKPTTPKAVSVPLSKGDYSTPPIPSEGVGVPTLNIIQAKGDYSTPPIPSEGVGVPTLNIIQARGGGGGSVILGPPPGWKPISEGSKFIQEQGKNLFKREQPSVIPVPQDRLSKPPKHPARMNFFEWKWRNSNAHFENSGHRKDILHGVTNDVEAVLLKINRDIETLRNEIGYMEAANFPEELLGEGVELTNSMLNMGANAAPYAFATAIGWATATLVGGFAIPAPEEIVTFPGALVAGLTTGMAFGVIKTSIDFEGSQVLIDMLVDGIPLKTARPLAYAAGVAIGLVELLQVGMFFGPVRMLFLKIIKGKAGQAVLRNILTKYFAQVGVQTGQEVIQEIIQLATQMVAGVYEGNEKAVPSSDEWVDRLFKVGYKSLLGFSLLGLPNLGGSAVTLSKEQMIKKMAKTIAEDEAAEVEGEAAVSDEEKYGDPALQKGKEGETVKEGSKEVSESKQTTDKKPAEQKQSEKDVSKGGTTISGVVTFSDKTKKIVTEFINADEGNVAFNIFNWGDRVFVEIIKHFNTLSDTRIELTNEEKKEYRQIESDLKRGDITVAESVVKHEELCKKAYTRALAESGKEKTQDTESDKVEPRVEVEKSFKELSEESEKLENRIEDTRDEIEKNQGITDLTKQEEVSEPLRQLESNRLKVDTALAQKAFDGAKKILHDLLGVTDEQFFDNSASIKGILNEYGLTDKPIGGAYFFNTRLISALNKVPSDEVVKKFTAILFKKEFPNADFLATFDSPIAGISKEAKLSFLEKGKKVAIGFQEKMKQLLLDKTESETVIEKSIPKLKSKVSQILTDGGEEMAEKAFDAIEHINPDPKAQERIINGRIKQIDAEIKALGEKLDLLEERLGDNKRKESLFNKIDKLTDEKILLKELQSDLKEAAAVAEIGNKPIKVAAKTLAALEKQNLKKQEQALNRGFREGQKLAKTDLKAAKKLIRDKINATGLDKDFKNALMNQVSFENITTPEQFFKSLEKIQGKIAKAYNKQLRKNLTDVFAKVKKAKSLNKTFVDAIKDLYTKTLNGRTPSELSNSELGVLLNQINALISEGVLERSEFQEQQKQKNEELDNIAGEAADNISTVEEQNKIDETSLKQKLISAGKLVSSLKIYMIENWNTLTDIAFNLKGIDASAILKILNADDAMEMSSELRAKFIDEYRAKAMEALGVTKDTAYQKQMIRDQKQVNIGAKQKADGLRDSDTYTFTKKNGAEIERTLTYSKAEIRYLYMVHANEKSHGGLYSEKGNKLTKEMTDSLFAELNETDKALIEARFEIYRKLLPMYNKIFKGLNGEDLKAVEGLYSPWLRDGAIPSEKEYAFVEEDVLRAGIDPKSAIGRVALSEVKFKKVGDESVMQHHISDVSHYIGTAEKMTEIRRIIGNEKLKDAMNSRFGPSLHKALLHASENMVRGRIKAGNDLDNFINTSNSLFASAVLRGKISILAKQLLSIPAYLEHISVIDLAAGMLHFGAHPREAIKILNEITSIRKRARNPEKAIANIGEQNAFIKRKLQGNPTVNKLLDANIHIGDIGAIYAGGWAVYRAARNGKLIGGKGVKLSHEQALVKVRDATKARQQSTDLNILSSLQTGNALERALTQFATAPLSYLRAEFEAVRHSPLPFMGRNKISYYQAGRKFAIYHFLLPIIWQIVADGFDIEEKHVYRAAILGNFNTIPIIGDLTHNAITIIMDQVTDKKTEKVYELDPITYYSAVNQFGRGISSVIKGGFNIDAEEFYDGVKDLSFAAGKFSGKPVETFYNIFEGVNDTTEKGFTKDSTLQSLGWPPVKETKKKKSDLFKVRQFK